jgi:hypothetical protein
LKSFCIETVPRISDMRAVVVVAGTVLSFYQLGAV